MKEIIRLPQLNNKSLEGETTLNVIKGAKEMDKKERVSLLRMLDPVTWYTFCQMEAMYDEEIKITREELMQQLNIGNLHTLNIYLGIWESHGMIRQIQDGFLITQIEGQKSDNKEKSAEREFKNSTDIIDYWCSLYEEHYGIPYTISDTAMAQAQVAVKELLRHSDAEIKATLQAIVSHYEKMWSTPNSPRPTLGAVCSKLYELAQPFTLITTDSTSTQHQDVPRL